MLRLKTIIGILFMLVSVGTHAQSIDTLFRHVPQEELPMLELNARLDMLDLFNCQMAAKGENIFGGNSVMVKKTANHLVIDLSDVSRWEMMRLPFGDTYRCVCIHSLTSALPSSRWRVYDANWKLVNDIVLPNFSAENFFVPADDVRSEQLEKLKELSAYSHYTLSWEDEREGSAPVLKVALSFPSLGKDLDDVVGKCLHPLYYKWNGSAFEKSHAE